MYQNVPALTSYLNQNQSSSGIDGRRQFIQKTKLGKLKLKCCHNFNAMSCCSFVYINSQFHQSYRSGLNFAVTRKYLSWIVLAFFKRGIDIYPSNWTIISYILLLSIIFHSNHVELFKYSILIFHFSINTQAHSSLPLTLFGRLVYQVHNKLNIYINSDTLKYCMSKKSCPILFRECKNVQDFWDI